MTIDQGRAELEVCFIHLAFGVTLFGLLLEKKLLILRDKKTTKTLRRSIMICLEINWLKITINWQEQQLIILVSQLFVLNAIFAISILDLD